VTEIRAHTWEAIGSKERIPRWPSKIGDTREIQVQIDSWKEVGSIGAKHYYVSVEEQNNSWWSEDLNAWIELSCDSEKEGYKLKAFVMTSDEAVKLAKLFVEMIAGKERKYHHVVWMGYDRPRWAS
jgi:hypothetical protein